MLSLRQALVLGAIAMGGIAYAQIPGTQVFSTGAIVANNCAKWAAPALIADAGKTCGGASPSEPFPIIF